MALKRKSKKFMKDAQILTTTGIGLSVASGIEGGGAVAGKFTGKLGTISNITAGGHTIGLIQNMIPKKKKRRY